MNIGGATTDIHSILPEMERQSIEEKGLIVTNEKQMSYRTVEGNLGMRVSASGILHAAGSQNVLNRVGSNVDVTENELIDYVNVLEQKPELIALTEKQQLLDQALAITAIEIALKQHAGYLAQEYNPVMGTVPGTAIGRDLRKVGTIIAVGGIFTYASSEKKNYILTEALKNPGISLLPKESKFFFDSEYIMYVIGVLSQKFPNIVLTFVKKYFGLENEL